MEIEFAFVVEDSAHVRGEGLKLEMSGRIGGDFAVGYVDTKALPKKSRGTGG
jgi:hypothetical protein